MKLPDIGSTTIVIFGASGDLTWRKLVPGLYSLWRKGRLPDDFQVVGFAWTDLETDAFRKKMRDGVEQFYEGELTDEAWAFFVERIHYVQGSFTESSDYAKLSDILAELESESANRLYYLAAPPRFFAPIIEQLGKAEMAKEEDKWRRVVIEKPFGTDLASAQALNRSVHSVLNENQIYRIDHYLAKETVQNILVFRFANTIFEPLWNRNTIDHVQITAVESVDVGHRAGYYDHSGVLRDMFQNHLLQLLALVSMEPPASFGANALRNEKVKVLKSIRPMNEADIAKQTVRGQYEGYLAEEDVAEGSQTATYAAVELYIDNWRWQGVPFYLRSGKGLKKKATEIIIQFKQPPHLMFPRPDDTSPLRANYLALCIQPHEGIHLRFEAKVPDTNAEMRSVDMDFHYDEAFGTTALPEAYERLLFEALEGDASLFTRNDGIEAAWRVIDPILQAWEEKSEPVLQVYDKGSWGPPAGDELLTKSGRHWRHGCAEHE